MKKQLAILCAAAAAACALTACRRDYPMATETTVPLATVKPTMPTTAPTTRATTEPTVATRPTTERTTPTGETTVPDTTIEDGNGLIPSQTKGF